VLARKGRRTDLRAWRSEAAMRYCGTLAARREQHTRRKQQQRSTRAEGISTAPEKRGCLDSAAADKAPRRSRFDSNQPQLPRQNQRRHHRLTATPPTIFAPPSTSTTTTTRAVLLSSANLSPRLLEHRSQNVNNPASDNRLPLRQLAHNQYRRP
jgi:hypothetical protein